MWPKQLVELNNEPLFVIRSSIWTNIIYLFLPPITFSNRNWHQNLDSQLQTLLNNVLIDKGNLQRLITQYEDPNIITNQRVTNNRVERKFDKIHATSLPVSAIYDVTLTLLMRSSSMYELDSGENFTSSTWTDQLLSDPIEWLERYVEPAFHSWLPNVQVNFYSQRLHAINLEHFQLSHLYKDGNYRYYTQTELSTLVNHLESFLGPPQSASTMDQHLVSTKPGLHLVLFIGSTKLSDKNKISCSKNLRFHVPSSAQSKIDVTDFAIVPQWGGLFSIDAPAPCSVDQDSHKKLAFQMVSVTRSILGLPERKQMNSDFSARNSIRIIYSGPESFVQIPNWKLDRWFIWRIIEAICETKRTLNSLINLLARLPNMVINDNVADEIYRSCSSWTIALNNLQDFGLNVFTKTDAVFSMGEIFSKSYNALNSSNGAFFDPSLLGLLYFEEDQKYGIYTPLFAPFGFALFLSTSRAFRILFSNK